MRKLFTLISLAGILFVTTQANAQLSFGVRGGLNFATMSVKNLDGVDIKSIPSVHLGAIVQYGVTENVFVESGLLLSGKGVKMEMSDTQLGATVTQTSTISPWYLEIPINALVKLEVKNVTVDVFAGPYLGYGIAGKTKTEYSASNLPTGVTLSMLGLENTSSKIEYGSKDDSDLKPLDLGLNFGAGIEMNNFLIRLQYGMGLTKLDPTDNVEFNLKNRVLGLSVGYLIKSK